MPQFRSVSGDHSCCVAVMPDPPAVDGFLRFSWPHEKGIVIKAEDTVRDDRDVFEHVEPCAPVCKDFREALIDAGVVLNPVPVTDLVDGMLTAWLPDSYRKLP